MFVDNIVTSNFVDARMNLDKLIVLLFYFFFLFHLSRQWINSFSNFYKNKILFITALIHIFDTYIVIFMMFYNTSIENGRQ